MWRFLKLAFARVNTDCLPLYQVFGPQFLKLTENLPQKAMQHFSTFCKESVPADLKDQMGESALHRAAEIMNLKVCVCVCVCVRMRACSSQCLFSLFSLSVSLLDISSLCFLSSLSFSCFCLSFLFPLSCSDCIVVTQVVMVSIWSSHVTFSALDQFISFV